MRAEVVLAACIQDGGERLGPARVPMNERHAQGRPVSEGGSLTPACAAWLRAQYPHQPHGWPSGWRRQSMRYTWRGTARGDRGCQGLVITHFSPALHSGRHHVSSISVTGVSPVFQRSPSSFSRACSMPAAQVCLASQNQSFSNFSVPMMFKNWPDGHAAVSAQLGVSGTTLSRHSGWSNRSCLPWRACTPGTKARAVAPSVVGPLRLQ